MKTTPSNPPEEATRLFDIVADALALPVGDRPSFLAAACAGNAALLEEARSLLGYEAAAREFLEEPAFRLPPEILPAPTAGELPAGTLLGEYEVIRLLGRGGMGEVYLARDTRLDRSVAVKLLQRGLDDAELRRRFQHEQKVLAALTHPNIARLYGSGNTREGRSYLVMEYVEGERLDRYCAVHALGVGPRLALFRKVCAAVSYAHQNLVIHRDLKPANIRVTPEGEPKLLDFGIAKLLDPVGTANLAPTVTLQGAMTPEYASPEQIKGEPITTSSDVYSLGVVLYELLTGQRPYEFKSRRPDELVRAICEEEPLRPSTVAGKRPTGTTAADLALTLAGGGTPARLRRSLEGDLDNIAAKALRKEPARRYASVAALSEDLRRHGEGLPVTARKDTLGYRAGKFLRRHRAAVAAGALVIFALVAGLIVATWQATVALRERDRAHVAQRQAERLNGFLEQLLGSIDPTHQGKDVKVAEVLDAASSNLDRELAGEPEVLVQAHQTLFRAYLHLGLLGPAERHARAAYDLERRLHGLDDPATAKAEVDLGTVLDESYRWAEAEVLLRHALEVLRRQAIPDHATLARALQSLSFAAASQGHPEQAEPLIMAALTHARVAWSEQSSNYTNVLNDLGNVRVGERDYAAAASIYRDVITLQDRLAPAGEHSVVPMINLCICLFNEEKLAEMKPLVDRLERDTRRLLGEKSLYYAIARHGRGLVEAAEGNCQAAIPLFREALPALTAVYPPGQTTVVQCRAELGLCLTRTGHAAEGEPFLRTAAADGGQVDRHDFAHTFGNLETALGECLLAQQRYAEAEPLLLTGYADLGKRLGAQNRLTSQARQRLHDLYSAWTKPAEAARFEPGATALPVPPA